MNDWLMIYVALGVAWFVTEVVQFAPVLRSLADGTQISEKGVSQERAIKRRKAMTGLRKKMDDYEARGLSRTPFMMLTAFLSTVILCGRAIVWPYSLTKKIITRLGEK